MGCCVSAGTDVLCHCDLNDLSRTAVELKANHSCNHSITTQLTETVTAVCGVDILIPPSVTPQFHHASRQVRLLTKSYLFIYLFH